MLKKALLLFSFGLLMPIVSSCTKESHMDDGNSIDTEDDVYYIRYASNGLEGTYSVTYTSEDNQSVQLPNIKGADFERVIGPVSKGFKATYSVMSTLQYTTVAVRIEVRKGNEPFLVKNEAVRTSHGSACSCSVTYVIE